MPFVASTMNLPIASGLTPFIEHAIVPNMSGTMMSAANADMRLEIIAAMRTAIIRYPIYAKVITFPSIYNFILRALRRLRA